MEPDQLREEDYIRWISEHITEPDEVSTCRSSPMNEIKRWILSLARIEFDKKEINPEIKMSPAHIFIDGCTYGLVIDESYLGLWDGNLGKEFHP
jgi:hypothetical protein